MNLEEVTLRKETEFDFPFNDLYERSTFYLIVVILCLCVVTNDTVDFAPYCQATF